MCFHVKLYLKGNFTKHVLSRAKKLKNKIHLTPPGKVFVLANVKKSKMVKEGIDKY